MESNFDLILQNFPKVKLSKNKPLVLFSGNQSRYYRYLYTFLARGLAQKDLPSAFLDKNNAVIDLLPNIKTPTGPVSSTLIRKKYFYHYETPGTDLENAVELDINLDNKKISYKGLNLYPVVESSIARDKKCYNADLTSPLIHREVTQALQSVKRSLGLAERIKQYTESDVNQICIVGPDPNYIPNGVFLHYIRKINKKDTINFIQLTPGYKHYFGNIDRQNWLIAKNLSTRKVNNRIFLTKREFQTQANNIDGKQAIYKAKKLMGQALNSKQDQFALSSSFPKVIKKWKQNGNPVTCLFPNLLYDRPINDETNLFTGLKDWLRKTVDLFIESKFPLIIKPHPAEAFPVLENQKPSETISDVLQSITLPNNIILLRPDQLLTKKLIPHLDLGLVWRSSIALELGLSDISTIVCGPVHWQKHLSFPTPDTITDYAQLIKKMFRSRPDKELKERISYLIINRYQAPIHFPYLDTETFNWKDNLMTDFLEGKKQPEVVEALLSEMNFKSK